MAVECRPIFGHIQCPPDWHTKDSALESATSGSYAGALIRLVGGYDPATRQWSRTSRSFQIASTLELGFAHMARGNAADVLAAIGGQARELADSAWPGHANELGTRAAADIVVARFGDNTYPADLQWLVDGWAVAIGSKAGLILYCRTWWSQIVEPAIRLCKERGWTDGRTLAAAVRMRNSGKLGLLSKQLGSETSARLQALMEYGHPDRTERINTWQEFQTTFPPWPDLGPVETAIKGAAELTDRGVAAVSAPWWKWPLIVGGVVAGVGGLWWWSNRKPRRKGRKR